MTKLCWYITPLYAIQSQFTVKIFCGKKKWRGYHLTEKVVLNTSFKTCSCNKRKRKTFEFELKIKPWNFLDPNSDLLHQPSKINGRLLRCVYKGVKNIELQKICTSNHMFTLKLRIDLPRSLFEIIEILKFQKWTRLIYPNCATINISFLVIHTRQTLKKHREIGIYRLKPTSHWMATRNFNIKNKWNILFLILFCWFYCCW